MTDELRSDRFGPTLVVRLGAAYNSLAESALEQVEKFLLGAAETPDVKHLVVDLSCTQYFGSGFIESLFRAHNRMKRKGGRFALCGLQSYPMEIVRVSKLDALWPIFATADDAVKAFAADEDKQ